MYHIYIFIKTYKLQGRFLTKRGKTIDLKVMFFFLEIALEYYISKSTYYNSLDYL